MGWIFLVGRWFGLLGPSSVLGTLIGGQAVVVGPLKWLWACAAPDQDSSEQSETGGARLGGSGLQFQLLKKLRQEDHSSRPVLSYRMSSRPA